MKTAYIVLCIMMIITGCEKNDKKDHLMLNDLYASAEHNFAFCKPIKITLYSRKSDNTAFPKTVFKLFLDNGLSKTIYLAHTNSNGVFVDSLLIDSKLNKLYLAYNHGTKELNIQNGVVVDSFVAEAFGLTIDHDADGFDDSWDAVPYDGNYSIVSYFPYKDCEGTLLFEDSWPHHSLYDMNDLVLGYNVEKYSNTDQSKIKLKFSLTLRASGSKNKIGFGIQLPNNLVLNENIGINSTKLEPTYEKDTNSIIFFNNVHDIVDFTTEYLNTNNKELYYSPVKWDVFILATTIAKKAEAKFYNYCPYNMFITSGNRSSEIHLVDYPPTDRADDALFDTGDDTSDDSIGRYYRNKNNIGWAILVGEQIPYACESRSVMAAYPQLANWVEGLFPDNWYDVQNFDYLYLRH